MRKFVLFAIIAILLTSIAVTVYAAPPSDEPPGLERAITVQEAHNPTLLKIPGVVGTAVGLTSDGKHAIRVFCERPGVVDLPQSLDGVPVVVQVTGKFSALRPGRPPRGTPTLTINSPLDGAKYDQSAPITFSASVSDDKDTGLEACIRWESSYIGSIGTGNNLVKSDLSVGVHNITASVTDSDGNTSMASVSISVAETGAEPSSTNIRWPRPVAIGISTGNANDASAGTIACRVRDAQGNLYALSNTHVYAPNNIDNLGARGQDVVQPGRYDIDSTDPTYKLGTLSNYVPIDGNIFAVNYVDAAIAKTNLLGKTTPSWGYGTPLKAIKRARLSMTVMKFGRSSQLTTGTITGVNATMMVDYGGGWFAFLYEQTIVESNEVFIQAGDSGSLLVSTAKNPVGLLFAGDDSGKMALANEIDRVLTALGVTIDGE